MTDLSTTHINQKLNKTQRDTARDERNKELLEIAAEVCVKHGGLSEIGNGIFVVDRSKFDVVFKENTNDDTSKMVGSPHGDLPEGDE